MSLWDVFYYFVLPEMIHDIIPCSGILKVLVRVKEQVEKNRNGIVGGTLHMELFS